MNKDKVYLKGHVIGRAADTLGYQGLMVQLENLDVVEIDKNLVHKDINEPQKVTVPQFVADWIEYFKNCKGKLYGSTSPFSYYGRAILEDFEGDYEEVLRWIRDNSDIYARAWLDGYTVEKEKRYYVRFKGMESGDFNYLNFIKFQHAWVLSSLKIDKKFRTEHTKKQLEEAGFGWVFDCEGIEIEEVE